ncbi:LPXTG cell wall anchor domain-containing protein, partial [Alkalihalobacillus clausii]
DADADADADADTDADADADADADTDKDRVTDKNRVDRDYTGRQDSSKDGKKLPDTATSIWTVGVTGMAALLAGISARLFRRKK